MAKSSEAIAAVNHWRGQCLDNFARAEKAIIASLSETQMVQSPRPPKLHEASRNRTRDLASALRSNWPDSDVARNAAKLLDEWSHRERQRNQIAHGCFSVRGPAYEWSFVNEVTEIKKGVALTTHTLVTQGEALAFLDAVRAERKALEAILQVERT